MDYKTKKEMMMTFQIIYLFHSRFHKIQIRVITIKKLIISLTGWKKKWWCCRLRIEKEISTLTSFFTCVCEKNQDYIKLIDNILYVILINNGSKENLKKHKNLAFLLFKLENNF